MHVLYVALFVTAMSRVQGLDLDCNTADFRIIPKPDCKGYYICVFGQPQEMPDCPAGSIFSRSAHVCVPENSIYNDCNQSPPPTTTATGSQIMPGGPQVLPDLGPLSSDERCEMYGGIFPHPEECQAYYNCSKDQTSWSRYPDKYMMECPYPQLFNTQTNQCDKFENVKCGARKEFTDACDYKINQCPRAHCIPCRILFPKCDGKSDGIHAHEDKLWSPYYVVCYKSRTMATETCSPDVGGRTRLFHPNLNRCVSLDLIPQDFGGMMPNCTGRPDGANADDFGRCGQYTLCQDESFVRNVQCPAGELFDSLFKKCTEPSKTCGSCGHRPDC